MSEHKVQVSWQRTSDNFGFKNYNRDHTWDFEHGVTVPVSAAPDYLGDEERVDPEQAFTAALASCHMLTFLAIASQRGYVVDSYEDHAVGVLAKNPDNRMAITTVSLRPEVRFSGEKQPSEEELRELHTKAHHGCFLANSVKTDIIIEL